MLYVIKYLKLKDGKNIYHMFDTHTESIFKEVDSGLLNLIDKHGMTVKNIHVKDGVIHMNKWPQPIQIYSKYETDQISDYVLLTKVSEQSFKLVHPKGMVVYHTDKELKDFIGRGVVANCDFVGDSERTYRSIDTYIENTDPEFTRYIAIEYAKFRAKVSMLGLDIRFEYVIEGNDVKITAYTGTSKRVIVPNFVTTILGRSLMFQDISDLTLNEGLKYIGANSFTNNSLKSVQIPSTVQFMWANSFDYKDIQNKKYLAIHTKLNKKTLTLN